MTRITVVGDALLDRDWTGEARRLCGDAPAPVVESPIERTRPGGAALAAAFAAADGAEVVLVTAIGGDDAGAHLRAELAAADVELIDIGLDGATPEKIRILVGDRSVTRVDRNCAPAVGCGPWTEAAARAFTGAEAVLVSDYGRNLVSAPEVERALCDVREHAPVIWDPHPRGAQPLHGVDLVTPNEAEAVHFDGDPGDDLTALMAAGDRLAARWRTAVAVTLSSRGALLCERHTPARVIRTRAASGDACGAGDRFAASVAIARAAGASRAEAVTIGVHAATEFVAGHDASLRALPPAARDHAAAIAARVRSAGGTVVAAGGCFDLLHAGHVSMLQAARALGDCLIVCVNSDASVRRLKGAGRPLNSARDRTAVLEGLRCVDGVLVFDEDTPCAALDAIRPHLFAKGGDYEGLVLPEQEVLASWGGRLVVLPTVEGHSTTRLVQAAALSA